MAEPTGAPVDRAAQRAARKEALLAAKAAFEALPAAERWTSFERIGMLLHQQEWIFAKTMPQNPHWYTLRRKWASDEDFQWTVAQLRAHGYRARFGKTWYTQLDVNDHFYWTMGFPINWPNGMALTILINRKRGSGKDAATPNGLIAALYEMAAQDDAFRASTGDVFGVVGETAGLDVLDIGCGAGLAPEVAKHAASFTAVDLSQPMLDRLLSRQPGAEAVCTTVSSFVPLAPSGEIRRFDLVLALFGAGDHLTDQELERIPMLLRPGGRAVVMFRDTDLASQPTGEANPVVQRPQGLGLFPGEVHRMGGQFACVYVKR